MRRTICLTRAILLVLGGISLHVVAQPTGNAVAASAPQRGTLAVSPRNEALSERQTERWRVGPDCIKVQFGRESRGAGRTLEDPIQVAEIHELTATAIRRNAFTSVRARVCVGNPGSKQIEGPLIITLEAQPWNPLPNPAGYLWVVKVPTPIPASGSSCGTSERSFKSRPMTVETVGANAPRVLLLNWCQADVKVLPSPYDSQPVLRQRSLGN